MAERYSAEGAKDCSPAGVGEYCGLGAGGGAMGGGVITAMELFVIFDRLWQETLVSAVARKRDLVCRGKMIAYVDPTNRTGGPPRGGFAS